MKRDDIIDYKWRSAIDTVGVVAVKTFEGGWKAYIGVGKGLDEDYDIMHVANHGAKLRKLEAMSFFPELDFDKCENV